MRIYTVDEQGIEVDCAEQLLAPHNATRIEDADQGELYKVRWNGQDLILGDLAQVYEWAQSLGLDR